MLKEGHFQQYTAWQRGPEESALGSAMQCLLLQPRATRIITTVLRGLDIGQGSNSKQVQAKDAFRVISQAPV